MAVQVILLIWLSERKQITPRKPESATPFYAVTDAAPDSPVAVLLNLGDPTLFALPHEHGFSGTAWLNVGPLQYRSSDWTEPPRWLTQSEERLGGMFEAFLRTNVAGHRSLAARPLVRPENVPVSPLPIRSRSTCRIEGDLAKRELLTPLDVRSIPHTDILTNTVVQVVVTARGLVFSPVVLSGSGSRIADQHALDLARSARFKPLDGAPSQSPAAQTWGRIIFEWQTLELSGTNSPAVQSSP
jgi:hypothetical protein